MERLKVLWKNSSKFGVITILLSCFVALLSGTGLLGIISLDITNSIAIPALGVIQLFNGLEVYKKNRASGITSFMCAGFIFFCAISVFAMKFFK